jgi:predicted RNA-binding protein
MSSSVNENKTKQIMKEIEKKTEQKIIEGYKTGIIVNPIQLKNMPSNQKEDTEKVLSNILNSSTNEFKEKTGRNPTYSEMREMYG